MILFSGLLRIKKWPFSDMITVCAAREALLGELYILPDLLTFFLPSPHLFLSPKFEEIAMMLRALETPKPAPSTIYDHSRHRLHYIQKYQCSRCMIGLSLSSSNQNTLDHAFMGVPRALKATAPSKNSLVFPAILPITSFPQCPKVVFEEFYVPAL
jgi:hypothetical protein